MGVVYLAYDPTLDRLVAIKVLGVLDDEIRARFLKEAKFAARVQHPHIVNIYAVGEHDGNPYMAMEYIPGQTLAEVIRGGMTVGIGRKVQWLWELASGLEYAHRHGIVHRDVKPSNLMIGRDSGLLRLLDFGIARDRESDATMSGVAIGTPQYMSPEQITGQPVDARSDIFAYGAVAYELLSGQRAFDGAHAFEITRKVLEIDPPPLPELVSGLPAELVRLVEHCLVKAADHRVASLAPVMVNLRRIARALEGADEPTIMTRLVSPPTPASQDRPSRQERRQKQVAARVARARDALEAGSIEEAVEAAEEAAMLDETAPSVRAVLRDIEQAQRTRLIDARLRAARRALDDGATTEADNVLAEIAGRLTTDTQRERWQALIAENRLRQRTVRCLRDVESLLADGDAEAAQRRLEAEPPDVQADPALIEARQAITARREADAQAERERQAREAAARARAEREAAEAAARAQAEREAQEAEARAQAERERRAQEEAERQAQAERERLAQEEAERQAQAAREAAERERQEREAAARAQAEREAQDAEARAQAERERLAQEEAARAQAAREAAERAAAEAAARAQAERERLAQEEAARTQAAREAAERAAAARAAQDAEARARAEREAREAEARAQAERETRDAEARAQAERERLAQEEAARTQAAREAAERAAAARAAQDAEARARAEREAREAETRAQAGEKPGKPKRGRRPSGSAWRRRRPREPRPHAKRPSGPPPHARRRTPKPEPEPSGRPGKPRPGRRPSARPATPKHNCRSNRTPRSPFTLPEPGAGNSRSSTTARPFWKVGPVFRPRHRRPSTDRRPPPAARHGSRPPRACCCSLSWAAATCSGRGPRHPPRTRPWSRRPLSRLSRPHPSLLSPSRGPIHHPRQSTRLRPRPRLGRRRTPRPWSAPSGRRPG